MKGLNDADPNTLQILDSRQITVVVSFFRQRIDTLAGKQEPLLVRYEAPQACMVWPCESPRLSGQNHPPGRGRRRGRRGRQRKPWVDNFKEWTGETFSSMLRTSEDRDRWRSPDSSLKHGTPTTPVKGLVVRSSGLPHNAAAQWTQSCKGEQFSAPGVVYRQSFPSMSSPSDTQPQQPEISVISTPDAIAGNRGDASDVCKTTDKMDGELEVRDNWSKKAEYILAIIGYAVGLGNVWRFPYLCFRSGGGAFLIPFFIMLVLCGVPLAYMEMAVGQLTHRGPIGAIGKLCPFFKGAGMATVVISYLFTTYYVIIITWSFFYMFSTFQSTLPWIGCEHDWSSKLCWVNSTNATMPPPNNSRSPTEDFYLERVLERSEGIEYQGGMRWELFGILLFAWVIIYFCIWKGPKSTGKVVYFTATFPYVVLLILLVRCVLLPGSDQGIDYFIKPKWELLLEAKVWVYAAAQNFNSLGVAFGGLITMSSYNKYNNKVLRDVLVLAVVDAATCLLAGFAIFSCLGYLADSQGKDVSQVVQEGPGLVFVIYPEAFTTMPVSQFFAFLFFFMLICLGIDSQFASVEVIVTTVQDHFPGFVKKYLRRKEILVLIICFISFLCGLPNITQGGQWFFSLIDYYAAALSLMILAFFETIAVTWCYGAKRLSGDICAMTGSGANLFFLICWYAVSPFLIFGIFIFSMIQYKPLDIAGYTYPDWAQGLGWVIALISVVCIPLGMLHAIITAKGSSLTAKLRNSLRPAVDKPNALPVYTEEVVISAKPLMEPSFVNSGSKEQWSDMPRDCTKL